MYIKVAKIITKIEGVFFSINKTPRNINKIQNGRIIIVDIGLAELCEILPPE